VGTIIAALTVVPTVAIALLGRSHRSSASSTPAAEVVARAVLDPAGAR
jgi:hypothetical protein